MYTLSGWSGILPGGGEAIELCRRILEVFVPGEAPEYPVRVDGTMGRRDDKNSPEALLAVLLPTKE